jgi:osmotically-inducible protein OsmY
LIYASAHAAGAKSIFRKQENMTAEKRRFLTIRMLGSTLLLLSTLMVGQSESKAQARMPEQPIHAELQEMATANDEIQSNLQSALDDDPILSGANLEAEVDDEVITLTGTVESYRQHQRVLELVSSYSSTRDIVDKVTVQ